MECIMFKQTFKDAWQITKQRATKKTSNKNSTIKFDIDAKD